jgi:ubiquinone/menaquinone biosynthesis C-methylase UbiE
MVNVLIHEFAPGGAVIDAAALAQFQQRWATYRKLVEQDYLSHREIGRILNETLNEAFPSPFRFLDIACGDASMVRTALNGTAVRRYLGIDLSEAALELAAVNLAGAAYEVELDHRDFVDALLHGKVTADAAWCSLSIHHLATGDKRRLMAAIRNAVDSRGVFVLYEPTRLPGEDRAAFLDRFERVNHPLWRVLTSTEWDQIWAHVTARDFPETAEAWCRLGRDAGFATAREVFTDRTDFYRLYRYAG